MGKKNGGKKSGKKSGKKKGKKQSEPQITWKEALLAYQINLKEKSLEDVRYEIRALADTNQRHKERNERLLEEQKHYMKLLLEQYKVFAKRLSGEKETEKEEVIAVMMEKWACCRQDNTNITDLKELIDRKEMEIIGSERDKTYWEEYKVKGNFDHSLQIELLRQELVDMQSSFNEMSGHLERTLHSAKANTKSTTQETLDKQKDLASEKAMAKMDKISRQEVLDNDWLKRETAIHRKVVTTILKEVESTEKLNIEIMSELFECTVDDLKISRNFYLTQFEDEENLEKEGVLEMDLNALQICDTGHMSSLSRPQSRLQAIEEKLRSMETPRTEHSEEHALNCHDVLDKIEEDEEQEEQEQPGSEDEEGFDGDNGPEASDDDDPFNNYHHDNEHFDDYLKLGPLELKLLSVRGHRMPVHEPSTPPTEDVLAKSIDWPVTTHMLKNTVK